ncbi:NPCBM/NEW2 domain-containing protein [Mucilaginibacter mali]|uniref:Alpha-galactosidase n=1 Tax=Mucilaginibacter mali TaxID=2740462 RepID=A0A7D4QPG3_9SPHI|nr:NPCBM/NEW2 domain-containing protein [Mucilaginibacter mali]QKJ28569.1 NPCBM/NEW2 domain-containing protein [Mucilaginibacter mali]
MKNILLPGLTLMALCVLGLSVQAQQSAPASNVQWIDAMNLTEVEQGWGQIRAGRSVGGHPITLANVVYTHGVGTHAASTIVITLHGAATRFSATVGVDDEATKEGSVVFSVIADGKELVKTPALRKGDAPQVISVDVTGAKKLTLQLDDAGDGINNDHGDWADAKLDLVPGTQQKPGIIVKPVAPPRYVHQRESDVPQIHGARIVGATPGHDFLFLVPATGKGPFIYSAKDLPAGLKLDPSTGVISGALQSAGTNQVMLSVRGPKGIAKRNLTIVGGEHKLALTPPMGWNSWNVWAAAVDQDKVKAAADELISSGLAAHGYSYINIDDTWEAGRDEKGNIQTNKKFPDMAALSGYIHQKGLRFGIYSSPGPKTCAGYTASYEHEEQDAASYAAWGVDYLKYDWCSYGTIAKDDRSLAAYMKPYQVMGAALNKVNRDILYSLCQYGMGDVWKWGADPSVGGSCWRTTGDILDNWSSLKSIIESQAGHEVYAGPGHWNDPDMLMVGVVGFGKTHPTHLKPNEQLLHISMWSLLAAPILIGCDMTKMDQFTLDLLANDETIDINQDPLGKPASRLVKDGNREVWARPLFDGTKAVGLVNLDNEPQKITVKWSDIGIKGAQSVRDLWLHKNLGTLKGSYTVEVPAHGCVLLKVKGVNKK